MNEIQPQRLRKTQYCMFALETITLVLILWAGPAMSGRPTQQQVKVADAVSYKQPYRPQLHFTPQKNWMNDPNGLVYFEGEYHLFYQYNPFGDKWGHMSWGHAVSTDLLHWQHLPVALPEENGVMIFSGSAVVDEKNTSGFGLSGKPPMVAIYTGYHPTDGRQDQRLAYSTDRGRTWTKYSGNPVIDIQSTDFRDPKVFWYERGKRWIMAVVLAAERKVRFYASPDLKRWTHLSDFGPAGAIGGAWECPDLFELPVDGKPGRTEWVLIVNVNPGGVAGGSGAQYFLGSFDGTRFSLDGEAKLLSAPRGDILADFERASYDSWMITSSKDNARWVDYGKDFYAVVSWSNISPKDGRRLWVGWMNNWEYGQEIPTSPWRSAQSIPREARLKTYSDGLRLVQSPVAELERLRQSHYTLSNKMIAAGSDPLSGQRISGKTLEIIATLEPGSSSEFGLKVRKGAHEETLVGYDVANAELFVDRIRSGKVDFNPRFPGKHSGPLSVEQGRIKLHLFVDWSSVEVFGNDGRTVITEQIFPGPEADGLALYAKGGTARLISLDVWGLQSIWKTASGVE
jgi:fructan beta-fructosidase